MKSASLWSSVRDANSGLGYALKFGALALVAMALLVTPAVDTTLVTPFTRLLVVISAGLINLFGGEAVAMESILSLAGGGAVEVANGCNAVEVSILMAAAILPYPASWMQRAKGLALCIGSLQAINLLRIISLLFLSHYSPDLFEVFHTYVWDALIVLDGVLIFFLWTSRQPRAAA